MRLTDSVADLIAMAGGFVPVADRSRLAIERLDRRNDVRIVTLQLPDSLSVTPVDGDVLRAFSVVDSTLPVARQNKRVHIEGEVNRPGDYILPPESSLADLVAAAGGLSTSAFIYGAEFTRESVRRTQQDNYDRALRDLETEFNRSQASRRATTADEAAAQASSSTSTTRLIERLRLVKPTGRVVLQTAPEVKDLPPLALEDGDHLYIPPRPTTVGVFGSVFNAGSYLHAAGKTIGEYLRLAGGSTRSADAESAFVIRANGGVVSGQQSEGWFFKNTIDNVPAEPGDTIFVPEEMNKTTFLQAAKEWTQILYQFGLGAAALKTIKQ
jgi:protein involved in polysaccharide export with SLBB domain